MIIDMNPVTKQRVVNIDRRSRSFFCNGMKRRGFTIVELLIVITIMGTLLTLGVASLRASQISARDSERKTDIETIATQLENYYITGSDYSMSVGRYPSTTLTSSGASSQTIQVLAVGGGDGGNGGVSGVNYGNGGGGGTVVYNSTYTATTGIKAVTIGNGGAGVIAGTAGTGGSTVFDSITATGGTGTINTSRTGGANASYSGGTASSGVDSGGGAGGGTNGSTSTAGNGYLSSISGTPTYYAGGGGGIASSFGLPGGSGGGGAGSTSIGISGTPNTGGGGGGANASNNGGSGGSGIVIIAYPTGFVSATGGTITTSGANTVHTFTSSGTFTVNGFSTFNMQRVLRDIDVKSITAPNVTDAALTFISATNNTQTISGVLPLPTIDQYVYQPLMKDGSLCTLESQECTKFNLYYRLESDNTVNIVTSRNQ